MVPGHGKRTALFQQIKFTLLVRIPTIPRLHVSTPLVVSLEIKLQWLRDGSDGKALLLEHLQSRCSGGPRSVDAVDLDAVAG